MGKPVCWKPVLKKSLFKLFLLSFITDTGNHTTQNLDGLNL